MIRDPTRRPNLNESDRSKHRRQRQGRQGQGRKIVFITVKPTGRVIGFKTIIGDKAFRPPIKTFDGVHHDEVSDFGNASEQIPAFVTDDLFEPSATYTGTSEYYPYESGLSTSKDYFPGYKSTFTSGLDFYYTSTYDSATTSSSVVTSETEPIVTASATAYYPSLNISTSMLWPTYPSPSVAPYRTNTTTSLLSEMSSSNRWSKGATAGFAATALAVCLIAGAVIFIFFGKSRRKHRRRFWSKPEDEKWSLAAGAVTPGIDDNSNAGGITRQDTQSPSVTSNVFERAPRVSLRHVSQFMLPNFHSTSTSRGSTTGDTIAAGKSDLISDSGSSIGLGPVHTDIKTPDITGEAASVNDTIAAAAPPTALQPSQLTRSHSRKQPPVALSLSQPNDNSIAHSATQSTLSKNSKPLPGRGQPSPTPSIFTDCSDSVISNIHTIPSSSSAAPVHRVQLDFTPSMSDELELRAGQLVKVLHEYDDGWALCIRLDRSHQGVCPRTCLSGRPVKPRPAIGSPSGRNSPFRGPFPVTPRSQSPHVFPRPKSRPGSAASRHFSPPPSSQGRSSTAAVQPSGSHPSISDSETQNNLQDDRSHKSPVLPDSPTTPNVVILPTSSSSRPVSPVNKIRPLQSQNIAPKSKATPRPAVAPIKPSPLSNETSTSDVQEKLESPTIQSQPIFHAL